MKAIKYIQLLIFCFSLCGAAKSQSDLNRAYFQTLERELVKRDLFSKVKFTQTKYWNGQIKSQRMFIQLKGERRYWKIGDEFVYFRNGILAYKSNTDTATLLLSNFSKYDIEGNIMEEINFEEGELDNYVGVFIWQKMRLFKFSERWPYSYYLKGYEADGNGYAIFPFDYSEEKGKHLLNGEVLFYNKNDSIICSKRYVMGEEVGDKLKEPVLREPGNE
jgi:antitoxin component YwqK of YwqJK toxin-antitoxin module